MKQESKKTPALRFPEFSESWKLHQIGDVTKISSGGTPDRSNESYWNGDIPWVTTTLIDFKQIVAAEECISDLGLKNSSAKIFPAGTILMAMYGQGKTRGKVGILGIEATTNQACAALLPDKQRVNELFLFQSLAGRYRAIRNLSNSGGQENLSAKLIKTIALVFPSLREQQKIAAFLVAVDEKIAQLARKKELLVQYKRGVVQQIFDQKIRFKNDNGNDFPDWEEKGFGEVFSFLPTNSFSREDLNYLDGEVKNIHYGDIHTKFRPLLNVGDEEVPFINKEVSLGKIPEANYLRTGDLIFADASEDYADVGKCIEIGSTNGQRILSGLHTLLARPKANEIANVFGAYLMKSWSLRQQIMREAQGTKVLGISTGRLAKIRLTLPSISEQARIARFISTIDRKIEIVNKQMEGTKIFKKGLLQQMFV